jgi:acyl dehydratase
VTRFTVLPSADDWRPPFVLAIEPPFPPGGEEPGEPRESAMAYEHGKITDEGIAKLRVRIGQGFEGRQPWRTEVSRDTIWHLAHAIGDLSPLYTDPEYAQGTRWGKLQCPGVVLRCFDTLSAPGSAGLPEGLPGVHSIWSGSHYEWQRPVLIGDKIVAKSYLKDVVEKESKFTDGRTVYQTYEAVYHTTEGEYLGKRSDTYMRVDRNKAKQKSAYKEEDKLAFWKPEEIERFMAEYHREARARERFWEDVEVGDEIGQVIKGPLTGTAEIAFESFFGIYLIGNVVAARALERHPKLMVPNEQGVPEPPQRVHWDNKFTQDTLGLAGAYDLGLERLAWMCHAVTNWIGDNGHLAFIDARYRRFNYLGDVTWATGKVAEKFEREGAKMVRLDLWTKNHREQITATAVAEAVLPSRFA